jgi:hypothetical protein
VAFVEEAEFRGTSRFEVRRRLGAGGMGVVYEAFDHERRTAVALKTLRRLDAQGIYRFKNEFRALADLEHQNLIRLHELHCEEGLWFFTMELVDGTSFRAYVRPGEDETDRPSADTLIDSPVPCSAADTEEVRPGFDERRLRAALAQLARGAAALHSAGKIHRDIKPSNVLVTPGGRAVLLDFGLVTDAVARDSGTDVNVVGTALYMAPEQAAAKPVTPAADWYAVGCVLYEALTGRTPFAGTAIDVLLDKQRFEPPPPRQLLPDVPRDLDALCVDLLRFDARARPSGAQVLSRLGVRDGSAPEAPAAVSFTQTAPFIGREQELASLRQAFDETRAGRAVALFAHGESGIGKSALVRRFTDLLDAEGARALVLAGRCYERESVPYKAFDGVVDALSRHMSRLDQVQAALLLPDDAVLLGRVFPVLRRVPAMLQLPLPVREIPNPQEMRTRAFLALRKLLGRLCQFQPLVLFIDDFQWADGDSLVLLADLLHPPDPPPLLLVATVRTSETPAVAAIAGLPGDVRNLTIGNLSAEESRSLVVELGGAREPAIADESRGHPLFLQELVRFVATTGSSARDVRLDDALWARIARLDPSARLLLELLAVAGAPLPQKVAAAAANQEPGDCSRWVSLLRVAFLVRTGSREEGSAEPYHDRVREAVLARLDDQMRRQHHRSLAVALEAAGADVGDPRLLVRHLEAAGETQRCAQQAEKSARVAIEALAFDHAAELYRVALRLGQRDPAETQRLRIALGEALANAGRGPEAAEALLAALETADAATRLECQKKAAEQLLVSGHIERGVEALGAVLAEVGLALPRTPRTALASLAWRRLLLRLRGLHFQEKDATAIAPLDLARLDVYRAVSFGLGAVDPLRSAEFQTRGLLLALAKGEWRHVGKFMALEVGHLSYLGLRARARGKRVLGVVREIATRHDDSYLRALSMAMEATSAYFDGRFVEAAEKADETEVLFRERTIGTAWELASCRICRLWALRAMGALRELRRSYDTYTRDANRRGDRYQETTVKRLCSMLALVEDRPDEARSDLEHATWTPRDSGYHVQHWYELRGHAEADLYEGRAGQALEQRRQDFHALTGSLLLRVLTIRGESRWLLGRLHLAAERPSPAEARKFAQSLERERMPYCAVWGGLLRAAIASQEGDDDAGVQMLRATIVNADENAMFLCAAAARYRCGQLLGGDEGRALCASASAWMAEEGIKNGERILAVVAPGFVRRGS